MTPLESPFSNIITMTITKISILALGWFLIIVGITVSILFSQGILWFVYPDRAIYPIRWIDVSHHQGIIDWHNVAQSDVQFAYLKATEGDDWKDERFAEYYSGARVNHIPVWAYHFYSLRIPGELQLHNIVDTLSGKILDLPIAIDLEFWGNASVRPSVIEFRQELRKFLEWVERFQWRKPILYLTREFQDAYIGNDFSGYPLWTRSIFSFPDSSYWTIWQYKSRGHIDGIDWLVDLNVYSGSIFWQESFWQ